MFRMGKRNRLHHYMKLIVLTTLLTAIIIGSTITRAAYTYPFQDPAQPLETRVTNLLSLLTQSEKIAMLHQYAPAISRLGIASFRTGTEALHGIAWLGNATVFPQCIGLGATFDPDLVKQIGSAVGDEARGFHKQNPTNNGLSLWAPVVDLERDPRAGRYEEGYSEDPYLIGQMAIAYCNGIKGGDPFYYKAIPTLKHFYAYNQEASRETISVSIDDRNKNEYYLKPFQYAIASGAAKSLMTSYNKVNGIPCTVAPEIMSKVWGKWLTSTSDFFVVTDAYGPNNLVSPQGYYSNMAQACAGMIKAGVGPETQDGSSTTNTINNITSALNQGLITITDIDNRVREILRVRFHIGEFDPAGYCPYDSLSTSEICASDHAALSATAAHESVVLLKNNNLLPLSTTGTVAVIGSMANTVYTDWYSGTLSYKVTPLAGIRAKVPGATYTGDDVTAAANAAKAANTAIVFVGNDPMCGTTNWAQSLYPSMGKEAVDRQVISLESSQENLIEAVYAANPRTILVLVSSFPYTITWANTNLPGIIWTCHSGQEIGNAIADALFGSYNPGGRLSTTWYTSTSQIPAISNYDIITGKRTYQYFDQTPLYPFGYGLSYTSFTYSNLRLSSSSISDTGSVTVSVDVTNSGTRAGDEVAQLYVHDVSASVTRPIKELKGFKRIINLGAGSTQTVNFTLPASELAYWRTSSNSFYVEPGDFTIMVGKSSASIQLTTTLTVTGGGVTSTPTPTVTPTPTSRVTVTATPTPTGTVNLALGKAPSADSSESTNPPANGNDGNTGTRWCAADGNLNHWWKVDLGQSYNLSGSEVTWESAANYKYRIETSADNTTWTVRSDKTANTSTAQVQNDSFTVNARYVRITVTGLASGRWASFFEFKVFGGGGGATSTPTPTQRNTPTTTPTPTRNVTPTPTSPGGTVYEAENAALAGGVMVATDHTGYSGTGFVAGYYGTGTGQTATFTVNVAAVGSHNVTLRYANSMGSVQNISIYVNGAHVRDVSYANLTNWNTWADNNQSLTLNAGNNTIAFKKDSGDGCINLDYITVQ